MKRTILILASVAALAVLSACVHMRIQKSDGTDIKWTAFGIDPKVGQFDYARTSDTLTLSIRDGSWSSDPGVRMMQILADTAYKAGLAAAAK